MSYLGWTFNKKSEPREKALFRGWWEEKEKTGAVSGCNHSQHWSEKKSLLLQVAIIAVLVGGVQHRIIFVTLYSFYFTE